MAWELHYTSARSDRSGRAGFQFVAETSGTPPGLQVTVAPYMVYRPPPHAPLSPDAGELADFPVTFAYDRIGERALLIQSRYVGKDYSGRFGNFFAQAVVAEPDELEGLRPVELWRSPVWARLPGDGELPDLDDLQPGPDLTPDALAEWLADTGSYDLLARLVDAVLAVLARGHGRVVLVCDDTALVARWLAVVSFSLPTALAARMSFSTYTAEPDGGPYRVVGTTPDVWHSLTRDDAAFVIVLDGPAVTGRKEPRGPARSRPGAGRFAHAVAGCWRAYDFAGLDALGELVLIDVPPVDRASADHPPADHPPAGHPPAGAEEPAARDVLGAAIDGPAGGSGDGSGGVTLDVTLDRAACLMALCRNDTTVTPDEEREVARLLARRGGAVPDWVWHDLVPALPRIGFDLATALCAWARRSGMTDLADRCAARCVVLALADPGLRTELWERLHEITLPAPLLAGLDPSISEALTAAPDLTEIARTTALVTRIGAAVPGGEVAAAAAGRARIGAADLPEAIETVPVAWRPALVAGAVAGLEAADERTRSAVLTADACDRLGAGRDWSRFPLAGVHVLRSIGRRHRDRRLDVTRALIGLRPAAGSTGDAPEMLDLLDAALAEVWTDPPTAGECAELVESLGAGLSRHQALRDLPARLFARAADADRLTAPEILRLAARLSAGAGPGPSDQAAPAARAAPAGQAGASGEGRETGPVGEGPQAGQDSGTAAPWIGRTVADAALVESAAAVVRVRTPASAAEHLDRLVALARRATPGLPERVTAFVARRLTGAAPRFRAELLAAAAPAARGGLVARWIDAVPQGALQSKAERNELMVVAIRLRGLGVTERALEDWARVLAGRRLTQLQLEAYLRDDPELRAGLRALAAEARSGSAESTGRGG